MPKGSYRQITKMELHSNHKMHGLQNNVYVMPATGRKFLNKQLKTECNAITAHSKQTGHKLEMKRITTIKIQSHTANTMAAIIANRIRVTESERQPIIRKELSRGILHTTLHRRLDGTIQKLHRSTKKPRGIL